MATMTFEDAMALLERKFAEERAIREEYEAKREAKRAAEIAEYEAKRVAEMAKHEAKREAERTKREIKRDAEMAEREAKREVERIAREAKHDAAMARMNRLYESMRADLSKFVELVLLPKLRTEVNKCGHKFTVASPNKEFYREDGSDLAEVDMLLENCDEVLAIEIKSKFKIKEVDEHLNKIRRLRKNESITGMTGRIMYAGIAGITIKDDVRDYALSHGMYVIMVREEEERIDVIMPGKKELW